MRGVRGFGEERVDGRQRRDTRFGSFALCRHHPRTTIHAGAEVTPPPQHRPRLYVAPPQPYGLGFARSRRKPSSRVVSSGRAAFFGS
jgi:hypothetical protein